MLRLLFLSGLPRVDIPMVKKYVYQLYWQSVDFSADRVIMKALSSKGAMYMEIRLGESIRRLRKQYGLTQEQLAEALGVTTGAVHKWESGKTTPELEMLVDIAEFFETSVDALLNYGWEKMSMGQTAEKIHQYAVDKDFREGLRFAEKSLQKYPNSFDIVYRSAELHFLSMEPKNMPRAKELYERAIGLLEQNTTDGINLLTIQNQIASCLCYMDRINEAVALFKKNNVGGLNNYQIGLILSKKAETSKEALKYLSDALYNCYSQLFNICIGYANAYAYNIPENIDAVTELTLWLHELGKGLRDTNVVTWMDRGDAKLLLMLAEMDALRGNEEGAYEWLMKAKESALKFDAAPEYRIRVGMKFYHGNDNAIAYDDMGKTAMDMIGMFLADDEAGQNLRPVWKKICEEQ